jgi:ribosomal protein S18 acetylase RimI-like enzyme
MEKGKNELTCKVTIRDLKNEEPIPYELLLQADPSQKRIESYIKNSRCRIAQLFDDTIGICVLLTKNDSQNDSAEIMNISIVEKFQGQGYGKALVLDAVEIARFNKIQTLHVGTGNSSIAQLGFYQRCGFRITGIDFDFFTKNYPEEIIENGIVCRDLIQMTMTL